LRHDVINAAAIIDGHAALLKDQPERRQSVAAVDNGCQQDNRHYRSGRPHRLAKREQ